MLHRGVMLSELCSPNQVIGTSHPVSLHCFLFAHHSSGGVAVGVTQRLCGGAWSGVHTRGVLHWGPKPAGSILMYTFRCSGGVAVGATQRLRGGARAEPRGVQGVHDAVRPQLPARPAHLHAPTLHLPHLLSGKSGVQTPEGPHWGPEPRHLVSQGLQSKKGSPKRAPPATW